MTTTVITRQTHVTMLKHLVAGKDLDFVATITKVPRQTVLDIVSNHGYPNKDRMAWAVDVLIQGGDKIPESQLRAGTPLDPATPARAQSTGQRNPSFAVVPPAVTVHHIQPATADRRPRLHQRHPRQPPMTLDEARASIGLLVVYRRKNQPLDQGVITSVNDRYVFVRYGSQVGSAATSPADLERVAS